MSSLTASKAPAEKRHKKTSDAARRSEHQFASTPHRDLLAVQRSAGNGAVNTLVSSLGGGAPLPMELRNEMEQRFSEDFSSIRIHTDTRAAQSAAELNAKAYTFGNNIVFNAGRFTPGTVEGKRLFAHELAHVVQQSRGGAPPALDQHSSHEGGAHAAAIQAAAGSGPVTVGGATGVGVAREVDNDLQVKSDQDRRGPFMDPKAGLDLLISLRGSEMSLPASSIKEAQAEVASLDTKLGVEPDKEKIEALESEIISLKEKIEKTKGQAGKKANVEKSLEQTRLDEVSVELQQRRRRRELVNKLAVSTPEGGGRGGHSQRTIAVIEIANSKGELIARIPAGNRQVRSDDPANLRERAEQVGGGVHAEEVIGLALREWLAKDTKNAKKLADGSMQVVVDQEVCDSVCKPKLREFAKELGLKERHGDNDQPHQKGRSEKDGPWFRRPPQSKKYRPPCIRL